MARYKDSIQDLHGVTYGNGQATIIILAALLSSILLLHHRPASWVNDLVSAALFTMALLKPNLSAPFFWLILLFPVGVRVRPFLLVTAFYLAISFAAAQFVKTPLPQLWSQFLANRLVLTAISLDPNLHFAVGRLGLAGLQLPISALLFFALGIWLYFNRHRDLWLLLGVATLVMRFWGFHWLYDNVFLVLPEIALIRRFRTGHTERGLTAVLLVANIIVTLPPGNFGGRSEGVQFGLLFAQGAVWLATLGFFLWDAYQSPISARTNRMAIESDSSLL